MPIIMSFASELAMSSSSKSRDAASAHCKSSRTQIRGTKNRCAMILTNCKKA